jgi:hypothetical protein
VLPQPIRRNTHARARAHTHTHTHTHTHLFAEACCHASLMTPACPSAAQVCPRVRRQSSVSLALAIRSRTETVRDMGDESVLGNEARLLRPCIAVPIVGSCPAVHYHPPTLALSRTHTYNPHPADQPCADTSSTTNVGNDLDKGMSVRSAQRRTGLITSEQSCLYELLD